MEGAREAKPNDSNQRKSKYFGNYGPEMTCFLIVDGLTAPEAADREVAEIDQRGLQVDGTGTLLKAWLGHLRATRQARIHGPSGPHSTLDDPKAATDPAGRHTAARRSCVDWQPEEIGMPGGGIHRAFIRHPARR
jgi:hypothetical protein